MNFPVFDLHCDTVLNILGPEFKGTGNLKKNEGHIDLERAAMLPGYAQCFGCFTTKMDKLPDGLSVVSVFEREIAGILREIELNKDRIALAYSAAEVEENRKNGMMSAILTLEGAAGFDYDPALLEDLYQIGFRIGSMAWNEANPLAGTNVTGGGLTDQGREFVKEAQRLGIALDVSHISDEAFWDIMDMTQAPIVATHSNSRAICGHSRNLTDDMFLAICKTGGVAGLNQYTEFIGENATLDTACDHIFHFLDLDPSGKHIALGGDLDGCDTLPTGFAGVQDYPALACRLQERGLSDETIMDIFWNNALGVMDRCSM